MMIWADAVQIKLNRKEAIVFYKGVNMLIDNIKLWKKRRRENYDLYYIVEGANWSISEDGKNITKYLKSLKGTVSLQGKYISDSSFIHFGSFNVLINQKKFCSKRKGKKVIATCFHIVDGDPRAEKIAYLDRYVEKWHTSCNITKNKLIRFGVPANKIFVIPLGIDRHIFYPSETVLEREKQRKKIGIGKEQIVIGSFQKDGNGWGEGLEPKLIKGPDVFCDVVERLSKEYDIFVLLSGPARGYVKGRLENAGIPYHHIYLQNASDVADLYRMVDIYMVTSREEGGPKSILEAMASGVPIISTKVGQAVDIIENGENGFLVEIDDREEIVEAFRKIVNSNSLYEKLVQNGFNTAKKYDMEKIVSIYEEKLYC